MLWPTQAVLSLTQAVLWPTQAVLSLTQAVLSRTWAPAGGSGGAGARLTRSESVPSCTWPAGLSDHRTVPRAVEGIACLCAGGRVQDQAPL